MSFSREVYTRLLARFLPRGSAWESAGPGGKLQLLLKGIAIELERFAERVDRIAIEMDPRTTVELLTDWEIALGLPDECRAPSETAQDRRQQIHAKLTGTGGQSIPYFKDVAEALAYSIEVIEPRPFRAGSSCAGDPCYDDSWRHVWFASSPDFRAQEFKAGQSGAGDPLRKFDNTILECVFNRFKPGHTKVHFLYGEEEDA